MKKIEDLVIVRKEFPCGCVSDNVTLFPCAVHAGPVATATNLRGTDPRLNVVHGPSLATFEFATSQGPRSTRRVVLDREGIFKVLQALGEHDLLDQDDDDDDEEED